MWAQEVCARPPWPPSCVLHTCTPARWPSGERHFLEKQEGSPSLSLDSCLLKTRIQSGKVLASWSDPEGNEVGPGLQDRSHQSLKQTLLCRPPQLTAAQPSRCDTPGCQASQLEKGTVTLGGQRPYIFLAGQEE